MPRANAQRSPNGRAQRHKNKPKLYAAVDLGTNNCRLLIARRSGDGFHVVDSHSQIARLGEGLVTTGELSPDAINRALDALKNIKRKLRHHRVGHVRCIATEACRKAKNGDAFVERVRRETGLTFKIIRPLEEVRLAAVGCHDLIDNAADLVMVLDIGGGSTEISFLDATALNGDMVKSLVERVPIKAWESFPLGVVTLTEAFDEHPENLAFPLMLEKARETFGEWSKGVMMSDAMTSENARMIGTSGTVTCLAGVHKGLSKYRRSDIDGVAMAPDEVLAVIEKLKMAGVKGRAGMPTIGRERAGLMLSGCAILQAAMEIWPAAELRVADRGLREGLLLSMMHQKRPSKRRRVRGATGENGGGHNGAAREEGSV
ncbi:MAG: Ppx/GppA phosphatase family protein [Pseudomonadota bacterium]